jgi:hypothetical protein
VRAINVPVEPIVLHQIRQAQQPAHASIHFQWPKPGNEHCNEN